MYKKIITYLLFSFSVLLVWFLLFLDAKRPGHLSIFIGLVYTFYGNIYFKGDENKILKIIKYIGPTFYLIMSFIMIKLNIWSAINPILIGFITLIISDVFNKNRLKPVHFILPLTYFYIYAFSIFPVWERTLIVPQETYDFEKKSIKIDTISLNEFQFLNIAFDTINLTTQKDFIIIESWNETCIPCIKAMKELPQFYDSIDVRFDQYYLYEPNKQSTDYQKVFNFKHVKEKNKIIVDLDKQIYKKLGLKSYPYFLIYDKNGRLVYEQLGYNQTLREQLRQAILNL